MKSMCVGILLVTYILNIIKKKKEDEKLHKRNICNSKHVYIINCICVMHYNLKCRESGKKNMQDVKRCNAMLCIIIVHIPYKYVLDAQKEKMRFCPS